MNKKRGQAFEKRENLVVRKSFIFQNALPFGEQIVFDNVPSEYTSKNSANALQIHLTTFQ
jgi:hypothetical protein